MGRLDNNTSTPTNQPDKPQQAVPNRQPPKGVAAEEVSNERSTGRDVNNPDQTNRTGGSRERSGFGGQCIRPVPTSRWDRRAPHPATVSSPFSSLAITYLV